MVWQQFVVERRGGGGDGKRSCSGWMEGEDGGWVGDLTPLQCRRVSGDVLEAEEKEVEIKLIFFTVLVIYKERTEYDRAFWLSAKP